MRYRSYRSIFPLLFFDFPRLLKYYLYSIHSLFVWRECLAHQVPIVLTVLSFRFSGLCLMVVNATIHFHGQASPVGVWSFLRLPLNPSRGKKKEETKKTMRSPKTYASGLGKHKGSGFSSNLEALAKKRVSRSMCTTRIQGSPHLVARPS